MARGPHRGLHSMEDLDSLWFRETIRVVSAGAADHVPNSQTRLPSRRGRSRSARIANGRLRHTGAGAFLGGGSLPHQAPWKVTDSLRTPGASTVSPSSACLFTIGEEWALRWPSPTAPLANRRLAGGGRTVSSAGRRGAVAQLGRHRLSLRPEWIREREGSKDKHRSRKDARCYRRCWHLGNASRR